MDMEPDVPFEPMKVAERNQDAFQESIRPLLLDGRESELCDWMKEMGLLTCAVKCTNPPCNGCEMIWKKARIIDKFHWVCNECKKKVTIRTGSFLEGFQCSLKAVIETVMAWCDGIPPDDVTIDGKPLKASLVKRIYNQCSNVTDWYILHHPELSQLGGDNSVVIVDIFPDGCMTTAPHNNNYTKQLVCIADTAFMPARVWAQVLDHDIHKNYSDVLATLLSHIRPGSTLVVTPKLFPDLCHAKGMAEVISVEALMSLDPDDYQRSLKNLETIWATTVSVCQEVQQMNSSETGQLLRELQWRQVFPSHTKYLLQHIVEHHNSMKSTTTIPTSPVLPSMSSS